MLITAPGRCESVRVVRGCWVQWGVEGGGVGGRNTLCKFESVHKYSRLSI